MNHRRRESRYDIGSNSGQSKDPYCEPASPSPTPSDVVNPFSLAEIQAATNDFDEVLVIGEGKWSKVYKGLMDGGTLMVAIKRLKKNLASFLPKNDVKYETEIKLQSLLCHPNVVRLKGFCKENHEFILVYEYVANGSLEDHLNRTNQAPPLAWKKRLEICIDVALGLQYLVSVQHRIVKGNIRSSKILLDENCNAKLMDFSCSALVSRCGLGYFDPEFMLFDPSLKSSDIRSFGCLMFEVLGSKKFRVGTVKQGFGSIDMDPCLIGKIAPKCFRDFVGIALGCVYDYTQCSVESVVPKLRHALELQEDWQEKANEMLIKYNEGDIYPGRKTEA